MEVSLKSECWLGRLQLGVDYKCDSVSQLGGLTSFCPVCCLDWLTFFCPQGQLYREHPYILVTVPHPAPVLGYSILGIGLYRYLHTLLSQYKSVCGPELKSGTSEAFMVQASRLLTLCFSFMVYPVDH